MWRWRREEEEVREDKADTASVPAQAISGSTEMPLEADKQPCSSGYDMGGHRDVRWWSDDVSVCAVDL